MSRHRCSWCGLPGHHRRSCHVEADGRREPDWADEVAVMALDGVRQSMPVRQRLAARLRVLLAEGVIAPGRRAA